MFHIISYNTDTNTYKTHKLLNFINNLDISFETLLYWQCWFTPNCYSTWLKVKSRSGTIHRLSWCNAYLSFMKLKYYIIYHKLVVTSPYFYLLRLHIGWPHCACLVCLTDTIFTDITWNARSAKNKIKDKVTLIVKYFSYKNWHELWCKYKY